MYPAPSRSTIARCTTLCDGFAAEKAPVVYLRKKARIVELVATTGRVVGTARLTFAVKLDPGGVLASFNSPGMRLADAVGPIVIGRVVPSFRGGHVWVPSQVAITNRQSVRDRRAAASQEPVAGMIQRQPEGGDLAAHRLDRRPVRPDAKVGVADRHGRGEVRSFNRAAQSAGADIDPVVRTPAGIIDASFEINVTEAGEKCFTDLRCTVAVLVGEEYDVRGAGDDHAVAERHQSITGWQAIGPTSPLCPSVRRRPCHAEV